MSSQSDFQEIINPAVIGGKTYFLVQAPYGFSFNRLQGCDARDGISLQSGDVQPTCILRHDDNYPNNTIRPILRKEGSSASFIGPSLTETFSIVNLYSLLKVESNLEKSDSDGINREPKVQKVHYVSPIGSLTTQKQFRKRNLELLEKLDQPFTSAKKGKKRKNE
jgi:hypothetical protein